jgi:hypothetical protein
MVYEAGPCGYGLYRRLVEQGFDCMRRTIEDRLAQCERLETALREAVINWRFYPAVLGLQAMRGVQFKSGRLMRRTPVMR